MCVQNIEYRKVYTTQLSNSFTFMLCNYVPTTYNTINVCYINRCYQYLQLSEIVTIFAIENKRVTNLKIKKYGKF